MKMIETKKKFYSEDNLESLNKLHNLKYSSQIQAGAAIIDVEALVIGNIKPIVVVEQVGIVIIDHYTGNEALARRYNVYQPFDFYNLCEKYAAPPKLIQKAIDGYCTITSDNYIHSDLSNSMRWLEVRRSVIDVCKKYATSIWAKGIQLEQFLFQPELTFQDLVYWGCPKYPYMPHDPLAECKYFKKWVPQVRDGTTFYY
jgi:hypothetical protein